MPYEEDQAEHMVTNTTTESAELMVVDKPVKKTRKRRGNY